MARAIAQALADNRRGYTPEWTASPDSGDAGLALHTIFARFLEIQALGLNAMPERLQLEFLESLGANVLAPQPARAPLVFSLLATASGDATVPAGTRVAAVLPPPAPAIEGESVTQPAPAPEFFTEQEFTAMRGTLAALYSIDPQADTYADHTAQAAVGFTVFDGHVPVPHRLYLGHGELFKLSGSAQIILSFDLAPPLTLDAQRTRRPLLLDWEYLSVDGWQPLVLVEDLTQRFTTDGRMTLTKVHGPDSQEETLAGLKSFWIRATVSSRTPGARIASAPSGYQLRYAPVMAAPPIAIGDLVHIANTTEQAAVVHVAADTLVVDRLLKSAQPGTLLKTAAGASLGTVLAAPAEFHLAVESTRDLLPGDVVTTDGSSRALVVGTDATALLLDRPLASVEPGSIVELADALPPLRPDGADELGGLPQLDLIRASVGFGQDDLTLDRAFLDGASVDISKDFHPFGEQPVRFATFYLACKQAFTRNGARIELQVDFAQVGRDDTGARIVSEYFDGARWLPLHSKDDYTDGTQSLTRPKPGDAGFPHGKIVFSVPAGWAECEVNGEKARWLRLRLADGDYGKPLALAVEQDPADHTKYIVKTTAATLQPPIVSRIAVSYFYFTNPHALDCCVAENDFAFTDYSELARWPRSPFAPFVPVADTTPALHFGFSARPPSALVSLLAHVIEPAREGSPQPYVWDYWGTRGWTELSVRDATQGLQQTGLIQFVGAPDAQPRAGVGGLLYRIRARLKSGLLSRDHTVRCGGVWLNAAWAQQGQRIERDQLGVSNGAPEQTFALPIVRGRSVATTTVASASLSWEQLIDQPLSGVPILGDEVVEVREWTGRGEDWQTTLGDVAAEDIRFEVDAQDPSIKTAAWVRWRSQPHFYRSGTRDRHYVVERATGVFRFPSDGFIPPAGAPIVVSYVTGGGVAGNVPAGVVRELRSGVGFVQAVTNPLAASGGAAAELLRHARDRAVQLPRHRDRAVTFEDYEALALGASAEVARARALPLASAWGTGARGFVGIVIVPHSLAATPMPSAELNAIVLRALRRRVPAGIAGGLHIVAPEFVRISVTAEILPLVAEEAGRVEALVRARLQRFLHPLSGGANGRGWSFGEAVYLSDIAALIESTPGVDAARSLQLSVEQRLYGDSVEVAAHQLVAAGEAQLKLVVPKVPYALA